MSNTNKLVIKVPKELKQDMNRAASDAGFDDRTNWVVDLVKKALQEWRDNK